MLCLVCFRSDQSWPESGVKAEGPVLKLLSITSQLNGIYQCEASNLYGRNHSRLYVHVSGELGLMQLKGFPRSFLCLFYAFACNVFLGCVL